MENNIVDLVYAAQNDMVAADNLIEKYLPFIKSETAKFIRRVPIDGQDDEISIAMFAFHEAVIGYNEKKGAFFKFAAVNIKNRLIDYYRKEKRHKGLSYLDEEYSTGDTKTTLLEKIDSGVDEVEEITLRQAAAEEIAEFALKLKEFGLSFTDIADNCPKQKRTLEACHKVLDFAKNNNHLFDTLLEKKRLPISELSEGAGIEKKTIERHRKYIIAIMLAFTNGYEIIRGHLTKITPSKEGGGKK